LKAWFEAHLAPRKAPGGYWIPADALLPKVRVADPALHVLLGPRASLEALDAAGRVTLTRGVAVKGELRAGAELVIGAGCKVGPIRAAGRVIVQASRTGPIDAAGDVLLLGPCHVGDVRSGGDIVIVGEPKTGRLEPKGRVATRPW
jgi:hypothetical protein